MQKMAAIMRNIDAQNPSGTIKGDLKRQEMAEKVYVADGSSTTSRVKWDSAWWVRIFPAAVNYFESVKRVHSAEGEVGVKKTKLAMNLKKNWGLLTKGG